jgi:hypothetical protein
MCHGTATSCTRCAAGSRLDLATLTCGATCSGVMITIGGYEYCREASIYINPDSAMTLELGTMNYPFKTIDQAFIEIFNFWDSANTVNVLVLEATTNKVYFQERALIVNRNDNIEIMTYAAGGGAASKATLHVINTEVYSLPWNTVYSFMTNIDYDMAGAGSTILTTELSAIDSQWYTFVVIQCNFKIDGFIVNNQLKLQDDDFAIVNPIANIATKTLTIDN